MADLDLRILLSAVGGSAVAGVIGDIGKSLGSGGLTGGLVALGVAAAATAVGIGVTAVKSAGDFQASMVRLVTSAGELQSNLGMVSSGILKMSVDTATSTEQLSAGMYYVESSSYHGAAGLQVLQAAAEGAKTENADLTEVSKALLGVMKNYNMPASQAASAMNGLIAAVQNGTTNLQDLSSSMGAVLPTAASLHLSFAQVAGPLDAMTTKLVPARQASMNLAHVLLALSAPSAVATKSMISVGLSAQQVKDDLVSKGLPGALQVIEDAVGKKFPKGSVAYITAMKNIMGGLVGYKVAAELTGPALRTTVQDTNAVAAAMAKGKSGVMGWTEIQGTFNFKIDQARMAGQAFLITLGTALIPIVTQAMTDIQNLSSWVGTVANNFINWFQKSNILQTELNDAKTAVQDVKNVVQGTITVVQNIVGWFKQWHTPILAVAGAITVFFLPAIIKAGVQAVIAGSKMTASFIANVVQTGIQSVVAGAKMTASFVAGMAKAGVEAVVNGAKITAQFVASLIKTGVEGWQAAGKLGIFIAQLVATGAKAAASAAVMAGKFIWGLIQSGIEAAKTAAVFVAKMVPALISMAADGIAAAVTAMPALIAGFIASTVAAWGFTAALLANPITWIVLAIVALIVIIVLLATHWKQVTAAIGAALGWLGRFFHAVFADIGAAFSWLGTQIHERIMVAILVFELLRARVEFIIARVIAVFKALPGAVWTQIEALVSGAISRFNDFKTLLVQIWHDIVTGIGNAFSGLGTLVHNGIQGAANAVKSVIDWIINGINRFINFLDGLSIGIPAINVGPIHTSAASISLPHIPDIPLLASGGVITLGGLVGMNEKGAEVVALPSGAAVFPHGSVPAGAGGGTTNNFYISLSTIARTQSDVRNLVDLLEQELGRRVRGQTAGYNTGGIF